jgi:DNA-binding response OmpR family regulator
MRILLVEDDANLAAGIVDGLGRSGMAVDHLSNAEPAESALGLTAYDLAIVDLGLPGMDGFELIRRIRRRQMSLPVLILTARDGLDDRVRGLDIGGDDYMVKPFLLPELQARIRALVRRSRAATSSELSLGPLCLDLSLRTASLGEHSIELTGREWDVLQHLMLAAPKVLSKQKLTESLGSWEGELSPNAVEIYISRLRAKLVDSPINIRTVRGIGYRLELDA